MHSPNLHSRWKSNFLLASAVALSGVAWPGCATSDSSPAHSVANAWQTRNAGAIAPSPSHPPSQAPPQVGEAQSELNWAGQIVATVDEQPITRSGLVDLVMRSHGASTLNQMIELRLVTAATARLELAVSPEDVAAERERMLSQFADSLASVATAPFDRHAAEALLETVLAERNISAESFAILTRRNAHLRKLAEARLDIRDQQLREEYQRIHGRRVQVRHIQLATLAEVQRIRERLRAGEDFAALADRYSAHRSSAARGGLLAPFTEQDARVPALFRQTAFSLRPGQRSDAIRIGEWYHLITVEEFLPADQRDFAAVRVELERTLRDRLSEPLMPKLLEDLRRNATIRVLDPTLAGALARPRAPSGG